MKFLDVTISALVHAIASEHDSSPAVPHGGPYGPLGEFVAGQVAHMTAPLRLPMRIATGGLAVLALVSTGSWLHRLAVERRRTLVDRWRSSRIGAIRDVIRFYDSLAVLSLFSREDHVSRV